MVSDKVAQRDGEDTRDTSEEGVGLSDLDVSERAVSESWGGRIPQNLPQHCFSITRCPYSSRHFCRSCAINCGTIDCRDEQGAATRRRAIVDGGQLV